MMNMELNRPLGTACSQIGLDFAFARIAERLLDQKDLLLDLAVALGLKPMECASKTSRKEAAASPSVMK